MLNIRDAKIKDAEVEQVFRDKYSELVKRGFAFNTPKGIVLYHLLRDYVDLLKGNNKL